MFASRKQNAGQIRNMETSNYFFLKYGRFQIFGKVSNKPGLFYPESEDITILHSVTSQKN